MILLELFWEFLKIGIFTFGGAYAAIPMIRDSVLSRGWLTEEMFENVVVIRDFRRSTFPAVIPGWHQNKEHWNTIMLDGSIPDKDIKRMISESYDLITDSPTKRIYEAVKKIPKGKVATYGTVAALAGDRNMARAVGNALHKNPDPNGIPCYRVVNSKGELAGEFAFGGAGAQEKLLKADGIEVIGGKVDLKKYGYEA